MTMMEVHASALVSPVASVHEFLGRYSATAKVVYGFVEGKEDPSFYQGFIDLLLPEGWEVELWAAGNKDQVLKIHGEIDWGRFAKERVCFFIDRDLSDVVPEVIASDTNIYVTDAYSIENDVARAATLKRVLKEVCGLSRAAHAELEILSGVFEQEYGRFLGALMPVMGCVLAWRRMGLKANLNDIQMDDMFSISNGRLAIKRKPKGKASVRDYIHSQCNLQQDSSIDCGACESELGEPSNVVRGKYVFWFFVEFCRTAHRDSAVLFPSVKSPKLSVTFSQKNGMAVVAPRARLPRSLRVFVAANYTKHIESLAA